MRNMKKKNLLYQTFDGKVKEASVQPSEVLRECSFRLDVAQEDGTVQPLLLKLKGMAALEFTLNLLDEEAEEKGGFYKVPGKKQKRKMMERNFKRRKKETVLTRMSDIQKEEMELSAEDQQMLEKLDAKMSELNLYRLESKNGVWMILAQSYECTEL